MASLSPVFSDTYCVASVVPTVMTKLKFIMCWCAFDSNHTITKLLIVGLHFAHMIVVTTK